MDLGLALEHVQPGGAGLPSRRAAARAASSTIGPLAVLTSTAVGFIRGELAGAEQMAGGRGGAGVDGDEVGLGQQLSRSAPGDAEALLAAGRRCRRRCSGPASEPGGAPATAQPIRPSPMTPRVLPWTSIPSITAAPSSAAGPQEPVALGEPRRRPGAAPRPGPRWPR